MWNPFASPIALRKPASICCSVGLRSRLAASKDTAAFTNFDRSVAFSRSWLPVKRKLKTLAAHLLIIICLALFFCFASGQEGNRLRGLLLLFRAPPPTRSSVSMIEDKYIKGQPLVKPQLQA